MVVITGQVDVISRDYYHLSSSDILKHPLYFWGQGTQQDEVCTQTDLELLSQ